MLQITILPVEQYDEINDHFFYSKGQVLQLEHSLVSLSKWESKWLTPFLSKDPKVKKTTEQTVDYIRCMTLTQNVDSNIYTFISDDNIDEVNKYIDAPMTATTFRRYEPGLTNREIVTAEIIYYWMILFNIPFECQKWHLNRLLTLINVCNIKSQPKKKMSQREVVAQNRSLNASRRAMLNSRG